MSMGSFIEVDVWIDQEYKAKEEKTANTAST